MISETIEQAVKQIVAMVHPKRVILFGSYAQGKSDPGSDLDLVVIESDVPDTYRERVRLHEAVRQSERIQSRMQVLMIGAVNGTPHPLRS